MATDVGEKDAIEDTRQAAELRSLTFSNYKRNEVKKELLNALLAGRVENSCYWCAELICSGGLVDVWNVVLKMTSEYINVANPKLPTYVELRYRYFRTCMKDIEIELHARNNAKIRVPSPSHVRAGGLEAPAQMPMVKLTRRRPLTCTR